MYYQVFYSLVSDMTEMDHWKPQRCWKHSCEDVIEALRRKADLSHFSFCSWNYAGGN